jgi:hypothetical protein
VQPEKVLHTSFLKTDAMERTLTLLFATLLSVGAHRTLGQGFLTCGYQGNLDPELVSRAMAAGDLRDGVRYVKTRVVIGAIDDGNGGATLAAQPTDVQRDLDHANEIFAASGTQIQFQVCAPYEVIVDQGLYNAGVDLANIYSYREPGYVNVFYVRQLPGGFQGLGGFDIAAVVFSPGGVNILVHELGHVLGLQHTFGPGELVDGSNCLTAGDGICDTPADGGYYLPGVHIDLSTCTYIGTETDANGDLYDPMLNNIMSYSPCAKDAFTPGQGQLMRYVLDSVMTYLLQTPNGVEIEPFPLAFCAHDEAYSVSATPLPGALSGPFVQGGTLVHLGNAGNTGYVIHTPAQLPDPGLFELVDAFNLPEALFPPFTLPQSTDSLRQSFRAGRDGGFSGVEVRLASDMDLTYRLRLYQGTDMNMVLLHDTIAPWPGPGEHLVPFAVPQTVQCIGGMDYSFVVTASAPFTVFPLVSGYIEQATNNLSPYNVWFNTRVWAGMPCPQAIRYYTIKAVPERPVVNLPDALCHADDSGIVPLSVPNGITASTFLLNGLATEGFDASELAIGTHLLQHIYTIDGCTDTLSQTFSVEGPVPFLYPDIPAIVCLEDAPFVLGAEPGLGVFLVNGQPTEILDPQQLGLGTHVITHVHENALDTITFTDQQCCPDLYNFNAFLTVGTTAWQAFIPQFTGELAELRIGLELFGFQRTLAIHLRAGEGLGGPILLADTIDTDEHDGRFFIGAALPMVAGNLYTWNLERLDVDEGGVQPYLRYTPFDAYPQAASFAPDVDGDMALWFQELITQRFACTDSTQIDVAVEICTGVEDHSAPAFTAWPNPFAEQVWLKGGAETLHISVHTADGRLATSLLLQPGTTRELDLLHLALGPHWLRATSLEGRTIRVIPLIKADL